MYYPDMCKMHIQYCKDTISYKILNSSLASVYHMCTGDFLDNWYFYDDRTPFMACIKQRVQHIKANHFVRHCFSSTAAHKKQANCLKSLGFEDSPSETHFVKDYKVCLLIVDIELYTGDINIGVVPYKTSATTYTLGLFCSKCNFRSIIKLIKDVDKTILATIKLREKTKVDITRRIKLSDLYRQRALAYVQKLIEKWKLPLTAEIVDTKGIGIHNQKGEICFLFSCLEYKKYESPYEVIKYLKDMRWNQQHIPGYIPGIP